MTHLIITHTHTHTPLPSQHSHTSTHTTHTHLYLHNTPAPTQHTHLPRPPLTHTHTQTHSHPLPQIPCTHTHTHTHIPSLIHTSPGHFSSGPSRPRRSFSTPESPGLCPPVLCSAVPESSFRSHQVKSDFLHPLHPSPPQHRRPNATPPHHLM